MWKEKGKWKRIFLVKGEGKENQTVMLKKSGWRQTVESDFDLISNIES